MRSAICAAALGAVLLSGLAAPATAQDGAVCALLADDGKRLDCYDFLFRKAPSGSASGQPESGTPSSQPESGAPSGEPEAGAAWRTAAGAWELAEHISKLDDSTNVFINVESLVLFDGPQDSKYPRLVLGCREGKTNLWIDFGMNVEDGGIVYRIDKTPAATLEMQLSSNDQALGLWEHEEAVGFAKKLLKADTLLARAIPAGASARDAEFPITGMAEAIKPLRTACRW